MNSIAVILVGVILALVSFTCGGIFCKTDKHSDTPSNNPILGVFGICLVIALLSGIVQGFDVNLLVGIVCLVSSVLPWLGYFLFYQHKMRKEEQYSKKIKEEKESLRIKQKNCSHPTFSKFGNPTYDGAYGLDQSFKCSCCGYVVSKWPEWDGTFFNYGGSFISKSEIIEA
ncbi:MAG: hypothetical protein ACK5N8_05950 [Alphaproteobacteria bacterium]